MAELQHLSSILRAMTSDPTKDRHNAAAQIEENATAGIRHKQSETQGKKIALLAAVTGLAAAIVGVAGNPPWDFNAWELAAFLVFIAGGILPGLYSVFAGTSEQEGRLTDKAPDLSLDELAALRYKISLDARQGADIRLAKNSGFYWLWVKIACASLVCAIVLLIGNAIFPEGDENGQIKATDTPETASQA